MVSLSLEDYVNNPLWPVLVETVHAMVMFPHHKAYTREVVLHERPEIIPTELATSLSIPLGEALVILYEIQKQKQESKTA